MEVCHFLHVLDSNAWRSHTLSLLQVIANDRLGRKGEYADPYPEASSDFQEADAFHTQSG